jgi:hypothetical protein
MRKLFKGGNYSWIYENMKKIMGAVGVAYQYCLSIRTVNPAYLQLNLVGLAVLFSSNCQMALIFFFHIFSIFFFKLFNKNPQTKNALTFLTHNISDIGGVN